MSKVRFLENPSEFNSALVVRAHILIGRAYRLLASPPAESTITFYGHVCAKHGIATFALRNLGRRINRLDHLASCATLYQCVYSGDYEVPGPTPWIQWLAATVKAVSSYN